MITGIFTHYVSVIFVVAAVALVLSRVSSGKKSRRREKADPPAIFGAIRGMYVCYQCDTIFNTAQCPGCREEALVPLIHLTGSILEDERVSAVTNRLKARVDWKVASFQNEQESRPAPASVPNPSNGDASEVPVRFLFTPERGRELS